MSTRTPLKRAFVLVSAGAVLTAVAAQYVPPSTNNRLKVVINPGWKYINAASNPVNPQAAAADESAWQSVNLPHCFATPWWVTMHTDFGGQGWYRKHFTVPAAFGSRKVAVQFDGAFLHSWIYLNGNLVGEHKGGFTGFTVDVTNQLKFDGSDNVLAVRVSCDKDSAIAPRAGDYIFTGGINRNVYLVFTDSLHVAFNGTFVSTPFGGALASTTTYNLPGTYAKAPVRVQTEVENSSAASKTYLVTSTIVDATGQIVRSFQASRTVVAGKIDTVIQTDTITTPHFWSPADPYLYKVYTEISVNGTDVDWYESPLGVRWLQFTGGNGFYLNGAKLHLQGFDCHQDHAGWAIAVTNAGYCRDIKLVKSVGANFVRGCHYPKDPSFVHACDSLGVCLMLENAYWGMGGGTGSNASPAANSTDFPLFQANVKMQMAEMIRSFRNNPSVIFWSLCNEPTGGVLSTDTIATVAKTEDPTRATCLVPGFVSTAHNLEDIVGGNGSAPGCQTKPTIFTEAWENSELVRPGTYAAYAENTTTCLMGMARWSAFDHGTHEIWPGTGGYPVFNMTGMVDNYRIPKRRFYYLRNLWLGTAAPTWPAAGTPAKILLTTVDNKTTIKNDGTDDAQLMVTIQNSSNVQINNNVNVTIKAPSGYGGFPTGDTILLATPDGLASIDFRSYTAGQVSLIASSPGLTPGTLTLTVTNAVVDLNTVAIRSGNLMSSAIPAQAMNLSVRTNGLHGITIVYEATAVNPLLTVFDLKGQRIGRKVLSGARGSINVDKNTFGKNASAIPSGAFVIKLTDSKGSAAKKVILGPVN
jgi:beta-galactosidase